jgi:hypothetical protein
MIPVPKGRDPLLVKRDKISCKDQLHWQRPSESNQNSSSIGFAEPRDTDCFRLLG